jgi:hypothetical protein
VFCKENKGHLHFVWQRRNRREIERREKKHENQCMILGVLYGRQVTSVFMHVKQL